MSYKVICHMAMSMDGKIAGAYLGTENFSPYGKIYDELLMRFNLNNWICGRVTFQQDITNDQPIEYSSQRPMISSREDYLADPSAKSYAIAIDPDGKIGWPSNQIGEEYPERKGDHIVAILSEAVSDEYLGYLQEKQISYIFAGKDKPLSLKVALDKLSDYFKIDTFLIAGGGIINGFFAQEELIDEWSLLIIPTIEGTFAATSLVETPMTNEIFKQNYELSKIEKVGENGVWLRYKKQAYTR